MARLATQLLNSDPRMLADAFLAWWLGELRALVPARLAGALAGPPPGLVLDLGPAIAIRRVSEGREHPVGAVPGDDSAALGAALAQLGPEDRAAGVLVRLPADKVLRRTLELPLASLRELRPLLSFELERRTPLAAEQACFDCRILRRDRAAGRMSVALAVARRETVEQAARRVTDWGVKLAGIGVQPVAGEDWAISLLPRAPAAPGLRRARAILAGLAGLALLLAIGLVAADGARADREAAALQVALATAKRDAAAAQALGERVAALDAELRYLPGLRRARAPARVLDQLARALPDGTWLSGLSIDGTAVRLDGQSSDPTPLVERLDAVPGFAEVHFTMPLVKEAGGERFGIALTLKPEGGP